MIVNPKKLPLLAALLGILALVLRTGLYLLGTDEKGLLIPWHPLDVLSWAVTAATLVLFITAVRKLKGTRRYQDNFSASLPGAAGTCLLALCLAATTIAGWDAWTRLERIRNICGVLAVPALLWAGFCRRHGKQPPFGCHAITCLYLTLYAVSHYQTWCSQPQLQDYVFSMAGVCLLALFGYYQTAFDAGLGRRRMQLFVGLMAGFFCIAALAGAENPLLYAGGAFWTLTNLCHLAPEIRRPNPFTEPPKDNAHESA